MENLLEMVSIGQQTDLWTVELQKSPHLIVLNKEVQEWIQEEVLPVKELPKEGMLQTKEEEIRLPVLREVLKVFVVEIVESKTLRGDIHKNKYTLHSLAVR